MRAYGTTPLYDYIELVFRSKRLFMVSFILATVVASAVAMMRAKTYSATAIVILTGNSDTALQQVTPDERGTLEFKVNLLNMAQKDPSFMRQFLQDAGLDRGLSQPAFDEYVRDVKKALSCTVTDNILEISCKWRTMQAEDIVKAFFSGYQRRVVAAEDLNSHEQTHLLETLLAEKEQQEQEQQRRLAAWQYRHPGESVVDPGQAPRTVEEQKQAVQTLENELAQAENKLEQTKKLLATTPKYITDQRITAPATQNPEYQGLLMQREELQKDVTDLQSRYTDLYPELKDKRAHLKKIEDRIASLEKLYSAGGNKNNVLRQQEIINPRAQELEMQRDSMSVEIEGLQTSVNNARTSLDRATVSANQAPHDSFEYKQLTKDMDVISTLRTNLRLKLEQARMDEQRQTALHMSEITMEVPPKAEPELAGAKSMIFYIAGPILGVIVAFAFSLLAESMDHSMRTPAEVEKHIGKPVLAVLPYVKPTPKSSPMLGAGDPAPPPLPPTEEAT